MKVIKTKNTKIEKQKNIISNKISTLDKIYYTCKRCGMSQRGYMTYYKENLTHYPRFCQYCGAKLFKLEEKQNA